MDPALLVSQLNGALIPVLRLQPPNPSRMPPSSAALKASWREVQPLTTSRAPVT